VPSMAMMTHIAMMEALRNPGKRVIGWLGG
jgi:hypothetical protein